MSRFNIFIMRKSGSPLNIKKTSIVNQIWPQWSRKVFLTWHETVKIPVLGKSTHMFTQFIFKFIFFFCFFGHYWYFYAYAPHCPKVMAKPWSLSVSPQDRVKIKSPLDPINWGHKLYQYTSHTTYNFQIEIIPLQTLWMIMM